MSDENPKPLSSAEEKQLEKLTAAIQEQQASWLAKGEALYKIDAGTLWRGRSSSLSDFTAKNLDMSPAETSQCLHGYKAYRVLAKAGFKDLPANEGQVRELLRLKEGKEPDREKLIKAWTRVLEQQGHERITAARIRENLDALFGEKPIKAQSERQDTACIAARPEVDRTPPPKTTTGKQPTKSVVSSTPKKKLNNEPSFQCLPDFQYTVHVQFDGCEDMKAARRGWAGVRQGR
jgi:hypothetical protein